MDGSDLHGKILQVLKEENEHTDRLAKATFVELMVIHQQVLSFVRQSLTIEELEIQIIIKGTD